MGAATSCFDGPSVLRLFGRGRAKEGAGAGAGARAAESRPVDFRQLRLLMSELKETAQLKRDKAAEYQRRGRECRAKNDEKGARLHGAACVKRQDEALEVDKMYINLDNLFEILQSRKLTQKSVAQMRECLAFLKENMDANELNAVDQFSDELTLAIDSSREITELVAGDHFTGSKVYSNRAIERALAAEFGDDASAADLAEPALAPAPTTAILLDDSESASSEEEQGARRGRPSARFYANNADGYETVLL